MASFSPYIDGQVKANYVVDNMNGNDNTFAITIQDTVAESASNDWYVQLNQDGVTLEEGKSYRLSLRMKSSIERKVKYCMQQFEGDWTNYSGNGPVTIGPEWQTFTTEFKMEYPTDTKSRFNVTMGSIDGERISQQHDIFIDDISLVEIEEISEEPEDPENPDDPQDPQDPQNPDDPGNDDPSVEPQNPDQPGTDPTVDPENPDQPNEPDESQPQEPVIIIPPVIQIIAPVVKVVKKIVVTVFSILRRLFW